MTAGRWRRRRTCWARIAADRLRPRGQGAFPPAGRSRPAVYARLAQRRAEGGGAPCAGLARPGDDHPRCGRHAARRRWSRSSARRWPRPAGRSWRSRRRTEPAAACCAGSGLRRGRHGGPVSSRTSEMQESARGGVVLVDEAIAARHAGHAAAVRHWPSSVEARIVLVGDRQQHRAVAAGEPLSCWKRRPGCRWPR